MFSVGGWLSGLGWVAREWRDGEMGRNSVSVYVAFDPNGRRWADSLRVAKQDGQKQNKRGFAW